METRKMGEALSSYYKMLLGVEPNDPRVALLDPTKITVSVEHDRLLRAAVNELHPGIQDEIAWYLWSGPRLPKVADMSGDIPVRLERGAVEFTYDTCPEEILSEFEWDGLEELTYHE